MDKEKIIKEIVKRYNAGEKESARKYFTMSSWFLSENTRKYFIEKFGLSKEVSKLVKESCDTIGGKVYDENGNLIYEKIK